MRNIWECHVTGVTKCRINTMFRTNLKRNYCVSNTSEIVEITPSIYLTDFNQTRMDILLYLRTLKTQYWQQLCTDTCYKCLILSFVFQRNLKQREIMEIRMNYDDVHLPRKKKKKPIPTFADICGLNLSQCNLVLASLLLDYI